MAVTHNKVSLRGFHFEDSIVTMILAAGIVAADVGKAISFGAAANTGKLAADDDVIIGQLVSVEDRKVEGQLIGAVALRFSNLMPVKAGDTIAFGDTAVGAGNGEVKKAAAKNHNANFVAEVANGFAVVVKI